LRQRVGGRWRNRFVVLDGENMYIYKHDDRSFPEVRRLPTFFRLNIGLFPKVLGLALASVKETTPDTRDKAPEYDCVFCFVCFCFCLLFMDHII
jgi:hypothetical protein